MSNAKKISAIIFFLAITIVPLLILFLPQKTFSENENRVLTGFPSASWDNIESGKFMKDFEGFLLTTLSCGMSGLRPKQKRNC